MGRDDPLFALLYSASESLGEPDGLPRWLGHLPWDVRQTYIQVVHKARASVSDDRHRPRAGEMHPVDQAFYRLAIGERDRARATADLLRDQIERTRQEIADLRGAYEDEIIRALTMLSMTQCPHFKDEGSCDRGCHQEPACQVDQSTEGWVVDAIEVLDALGTDRDKQGATNHG